MARKRNQEEPLPLPATARKAARALERDSTGLGWLQAALTAEIEAPAGPSRDAAMEFVAKTLSEIAGRVYAVASELRASAGRA